MFTNNFLKQFYSINIYPYVSALYDRFVAWNQYFPLFRRKNFFKTFSSVQCTENPFDFSHTGGKMWVCVMFSVRLSRFGKNCNVAIFSEPLKMVTVRLCTMVQCTFSAVPLILLSWPWTYLYKVTLISKSELKAYKLYISGSSDPVRLRLSVIVKHQKDYKWMLLITRGRRV